MPLEDDSHQHQQKDGKISIFKRVAQMKEEELEEFVSARFAVDKIIERNTRKGRYIDVDTLNEMDFLSLYGQGDYFFPKAEFIEAGEETRTIYRAKIAQFQENALVHLCLPKDTIKDLKWQYGIERISQVADLMSMNKLFLWRDPNDENYVGRDEQLVREYFSRWIHL